MTLMLIVSFFILLTAVALPSVQMPLNLLARTLSLIFLSAAVLVANSYSWTGLGTGLSLYSGLTNITGVTLLGQMLMLVAGAMAITPWATNNMKPGWTSKSLDNSKISLSANTYPLFALLTVIGGCMLVTSGDLITIYLALELQSFSLYVLAAYHRDSESSTHSGLLYFLLGGLSSCFIGLGFALVYSQTGLTSIEGLMNVISIEENGKFNWAIIMGFISILSGLLFKITAAPFHHWGPDVYNGVPTIVTTWLAVLPKISLVFLLLTLSSNISGKLVYLTYFNVQYDIWTTGLILSSILSLIIGTTVGLAQSRIKRLLAYSTISHMGFILASLSLSTQEGAAATILYLVQYTLTTLLAFSTLLALTRLNKQSKNLEYNNSYKTADLDKITELTGMFKNKPALCVCLATALFSMAGVPPLLGFYGKLAVLYATMNSNLIFVSLLAIVTSVISASYYLKLVRVSYFGDENSSSKKESMNTVNLSSLHSYLLSVITLMTICFMASPDLLLDTTRLLALTLYGA